MTTRGHVRRRYTYVYVRASERREASWRTDGVTGKGQTYYCINITLCTMYVCYIIVRSFHLMQLFRVDLWPPLRS